MIRLDLIQGSPEWLQSRQTSRNASNAPSMMGDQAYGMTRNKLMHFMVTGEQEAITPFMLERFEAGHRAESLARSIADELVGEDLFPVVGESDDGYLRASFDGLTMAQHINWEHKLYSDKLAEMVRSGNLSPHYVWQLEHQAIVSGCEKILFMCSDGTPDLCEWMWYVPNKDLQARLIEGWKRFDKDLDEYKAPVERNDEDWLGACERYREAKTRLDSAQSEIDAAKEELIELAGKRSAKGCGLSLARVDRAGSVKWAEVAKALNPSAELIAKYTGKSVTSYRIDI